jgi:hypothetical protein
LLKWSTAFVPGLDDFVMAGESVCWLFTRHTLTKQCQQRPYRIRRT